MKSKRAAFVAQLIRSGMTPEQAEAEVLEFQRNSEGLAVSKKALMNEKDWVDEKVEKIKQETEASARKVPQKKEEPIDDMEDILNDFEEKGFIQKEN